MWEGGIRAFSQKGLFSSASLFMCLSVASDNLFQIIISTALNAALSRVFQVGEFWPPHVI